MKFEVVIFESVFSDEIIRRETIEAGNWTEFLDKYSVWKQTHCKQGQCADFKRLN